jgi:hypothetical protein
LLLGQSVGLDGRCAAPTGLKAAASAMPIASLEVNVANVRSPVVPLLAALLRMIVHGCAAEHSELRRQRTL